MARSCGRGSNRSVSPGGGYTEILFPTLVFLNLLGILRWRVRGLRPVWLLPAAVILFLFCWMPVSMLVMRAVQAPYSREAPDAGDAGAIVILAGAIRDPFPPRPFPLLGGNTFERCSYGAWYSHRAPGLPLLLSGGKVEAADVEPYAITMKRFLVSAGVPESSIWVEDGSRSTAENAVNSARILREKGIRKVVLITDAVHMNRAARCFLRQGIAIVPAPCGFRPAYQFGPYDLLPSWSAIEWNEQVTHEWLGLVWYRLRGAA